MALSLDRIVQAALDLIDQDGLEALSMRRLGRALGVRGMALYRYVDSKDALLDHLVARLLAPLAALSTTGRWRADATGLAHGLRDQIHRHPNALPLLVARPARVGDALAALQSAVAVLQGAGFSPMDALVGVQAVFEFTLGHAMVHHSQSLSFQADDDRPLVDADAVFERGLAIFLDGLEQRLAPAGLAEG